MEQYQYVEGFQRFHNGWFEAKMCGLSLLAIFTFWVKVSAFDNKSYLQASETQRY